MIQKIRSFYAALGPGLLYAGAAIGVSHLVQSTRAGADFGFQLVWAVILANILKYPFFEIGPRYTAATGKSLLEGYKGMGNWALVLFLFLTIGTMFTIQAAVTIVTAGLANQLFGMNLDPRFISIGVLAICSLILIAGHYSFLDRLMKVIITLLAITTLGSVIGAVTTSELAPIATNPFNFEEKAHIFFLIALVGWMPAPLDISVWHSMWAVAKNETIGERLSLKATLFDFKVGYFGTAILALGFISLGALVMFGSGQSFEGGASQFAGQLIGLYTESLGKWAFPIIAVAAFTTMFSTTLTCLDAFPRVLRRTTVLLIGKDKEHGKDFIYNIWLAFTVIGALTILFLFLKNMKNMVDLATTMSFLVAPIYAILNFAVIHRPEVSKKFRPPGWHKLLSLVGFLFLTLFGMYYLSVKYF